MLQAKFEYFVAAFCHWQNEGDDILISGLNDRTSNDGDGLDFVAGAVADAEVQFDGFSS